MAKPLILDPNWVDSTYYTVTFSNGSWSTVLPLSNLREPLLSKVARSSDAALASTKLDVNLGAVRPVRAVVIPKSNMSRSALVRVTAANDASFSDIVLQTSWTDYWRTVYEHGTLPYGHPSWFDLKISPEDAAGYPMPFIYVGRTDVLAQHWRIEIDDTGNADGYVEIGRLFLAQGWQPTKGIAFGNTLGWEDDSVAEKTLGGAIFYDERTPRRVIHLAINAIPVNEALSLPFETARRQRTTKQVYLVFDPDDTIHLHRRSFLATLRTLNPLEYPVGNGINNVPMELMEVIA